MRFPPKSGTAWLSSDVREKMKRLSLQIAIASFAFVAVAQDELPRDTTQLAEKLTQFSAERRAAAEKEISEKQKRVVVILRTHLERETKKGNLKGALAIQSLIDSLTQTKEKVATNPQTSHAMVKRKPTPKLLEGTKWKNISGETVCSAIDFVSDEKCDATVRSTGNAINQTFTVGGAPGEETFKLKLVPVIWLIETEDGVPTKLVNQKSGKVDFVRED